jgi:hypothetical protein
LRYKNESWYNSRPDIRFCTKHYMKDEKDEKDEKDVKDVKDVQGAGR